MINITDIQQHEVTFAEYLQLPGYSHSFLKRNAGGIAYNIDVTPMMELGSMVDAIITHSVGSKPIDMMHPLFRHAKFIATTIMMKYPHLKAFRGQVAYTGVMTDDVTGLSMPVKVLPDLVADGISVELKITSTKLSQIETLINHMGYDNQVWLQRMMVGGGKLAKGYLMPYSVADDVEISGKWMNRNNGTQVCMIGRECTESELWWLGKVREFGE